MNLRGAGAPRTCVLVHVRTWLCVYTGAGGCRSHAPSVAPSPLPCSFTCPHPDIFVPQSGLRQLAPSASPRSPASPGLHAHSPPGPTPYSPLPWGPLSPSPQPFLHGDAQVPLPPGSVFLARSVSRASSRLVPAADWAHTTSRLPAASSGGFQGSVGLGQGLGSRPPRPVCMQPQASPGAWHVLGAQRTLSG